MEILAGKANIAVKTATDGGSIEPDHFYVIPPNTTLTVNDGVLRLASGEEAERPRKPVNILFRSLAEEHGHRTVAVALSGTDADGAEGLEEVTAADSAYADLLQHEPAEINALAQDFLIRVTGFFRDPSTASIVKAASRQAPI